MSKTSNGRRAFLATCAMAGAAATRPLAAFGQAVDNARQASSPSALRITELKAGYVRGSLFVKIHTNQGIWGCGEAVDAIGGTSPEAHRAGLDRVIQAGGQPISWVSLAVELQRDWARQDTVVAVVEIVLTDAPSLRAPESTLQ